MTKKEINRTKIQDYAVYLSKKFKHVILSWATGCGKSLAAIRIIDEDIKDNNDNWNRWYIVVAERQHIKNWEDEFRLHGYQRLIDLGYVEIFCYQSLHKYTNRQANIVLDEAHSVTDLRLDCLSTIKGEKIISLSATIDAERAKQLSLLSPYHKYEITTDKAIKAEILPLPVVVKIDFDLSPKLREAYDNISKMIDTYVNSIYNEKLRLEQLIELTPTAKIIGDIRTSIIKAEADLMSLRMRRKNLLANAKTSTVAKLQKSIIAWDKKYIIFTGNILQCKKLGASTITNASFDISSDNSNKVNDIRIDKFNNNVIRGLVCNKMLRQGTNLSGIQMGIITQLDSKQLSFVQMMGRIFRSSSPVLFVFVCRNSVDEVYWEECARGLDPTYIMSYNDYIHKYYEKS